MYLVGKPERMRVVGYKNINMSPSGPGTKYDFAGDSQQQFTGTRTEPERMRPLVRPKHRWVDNIKMGLSEVGGGCMEWINLAQHRD
jgi:hypothetical protein